MSKIKVVLAGNPNSGKTSIFNQLTGANQHVGNWGGVTVEFKEGEAVVDGTKIDIVDLPGTYSLSAYSMEEKVARDYILQEKPDVVVNVIDASNLERNLYLTIQLMELGIKPILAFNMWDEVKKRAITIDIEKLQKLFKVKIFATVGKTGAGTNHLIKEAIKQAENKEHFEDDNILTLPEELRTELDKFSSMKELQDHPVHSAKWMSQKLLENDSQIEEIVQELENSDIVLSKRDEISEKTEELLGDDPETLIASARYGFIAGAVKECLSVGIPDRVEHSEKIDSILTHKFWAFPIFFGFMWLLFQATFRLGEYPMGWIESLFGWFAILADNNLADGNFKNLLIDGVIGGVGGVAVFLPNIMILFLGIAIMEDTGYMARAAFITDRIMHKIGLHGKSFIPMIMGMGCSVPAIMAARTLESKADRIKTILLTPLISCSARLPVYVLFAGALFPKHAGNVIFLFQVILGFTAFFVMGWLFKKTLFRNKEDLPFVMELPPYRMPTMKSILIHMWHKAEHYLKKMGGVVLLFSIILWFAGEFPKSPEIEAKFDKKIETVQSNINVPHSERDEIIETLQNQKTAEVMSKTYIGQVGKVFEPLVVPLGFDWRGAVSLITGFVAKEVVVSSMGVLYAVGEEQGEDSETLRDKIAQNFTPLSAIAFMLFVLLYTPCVVALITIIRELKNWKWSLFSVGYQLVLAWTAAFIVFQGGKLLGLG